MKDKHYDINYLQNTRKLLEDLKKRSYNFFNEINSGTIIDLGCGAGTDVLEISKQLGNDVKVIGIDHDGGMVEQAKRSAEGYDNVDFLLSEAYPLPFEDDSIAGLRTERVIQHLKNPDQVFKEIHRILKKDHPFVIIETDWHSLSFYTEFTETQRKINSYLTDVKINNGFAARKLSSYLKLSNFRNIKFDIHPFVINSLDEANDYFWIEKIVKEVFEKGYITSGEYAAFYGALQQSDADNYFASSINLVVTSCIK